MTRVQRPQDYPHRQAIIGPRPEAGVCVVFADTDAGPSADTLAQLRDAVGLGASIAIVARTAAGFDAARDALLAIIESTGPATVN